MIKRITAYVFLVLANLLLLAHAVVPHHHHHHLVCFEKEHCINDGIHHEHGLPEHNHQHDNDPDRNTCLLSEFVVTTTNHISKLSGNPIDTDSFLSILNDFFLSGVIVPSSPPTTNLSFAPHLEPLYASLSRAPFGSRPPPC